MTDRRVNVDKVACPSCGASVSVPEGTAQVRCAYCGSALSVRGHQGVVQPAAAGPSGRDTAGAASPDGHPLGALSESTGLELLRYQARQDLLSAQSQLSTVQAVIENLQHQPVTEDNFQQLLELRHQEALLQSRLARLDDIIRHRDRPHVSDLFAGLGLPSGDAARATGCAVAFLILLLAGNGLSLGRWYGLQQWACTLPVFLLLGALLLYALYREH